MIRFLADMGVSMTTVGELRSRGFDVVHLRDQQLIRMPDNEIVLKARAEDRIILTFELDFSDIMAASGGTSPTANLFRLRNQTPKSVTPRLLRVIDECGGLLESGCFITVEDSGYRRRTLLIR